MNDGKKEPRRCKCGCYPVERWLPFAKCYVIECDCCKRSQMHVKKAMVRLLWSRLDSEWPEVKGEEF